MIDLKKTLDLLSLKERNNGTSAISYLQFASELFSTFQKWAYLELPCNYPKLVLLSKYIPSTQQQLQVEPFRIQYSKMALHISVIAFATDQLTNLLVLTNQLSDFRTVMKFLTIVLFFFLQYDQQCKSNAGTCQQLLSKVILLVLFLIALVLIFLTLPYYHKNIQDTLKIKNSIIKELKAKGLNALNTEGNFFLIKSEKVEEIIIFLRNNNIYVRALSHLEGMENYIRISVPIKQSDKIKLVNALIKCNER